MNLHAIVSGAVSAINPMQTATLRASAGYTQAADGSQVPAYAAPVTVSAQIQALTYSDLKQLDGLNQTGDARAIYVSGSMNGVSRPDVSGGDMLIIAGQNWLVTQSLEQWPDWVKIAAVRQL